MMVVQVMNWITVLNTVRETTLHGQATQAQYIYQHSYGFSPLESRNQRF